MLAAAHGQADAGAHLVRLSLPVQRVGLNRRAQLLANDQTLRHRAARQQHGKLVAAQARHHVVAAQAACQRRGHASQQRVAGSVPGAVVDLLEAVEIDEQRAERMFSRVGHGGLQPRFKGSAVEQPGQRIVVGRPGQADALMARVSHVLDNPDRAGRPVARHHGAAAHAGPERLTIAPHQFHFALEVALHRERRCRAVGKRQVGGIAGVDRTRRLAQHVARLAGEHFAQLAAYAHEVAVDGERNAYLGMVQHRLHLQQQHLGLPLLLAAFGQQVFEGAAHVAQFVVAMPPGCPVDVDVDVVMRGQAQRPLAQPVDGAHRPGSHGAGHQGRERAGNRRCTPGSAAGSLKRMQRHRLRGNAHQQPVRTGDAHRRNQVAASQPGLALQVDRAAVVAPALDGCRHAGVGRRRAEQLGRIGVRQHHTLPVDHHVDGALRAAVHAVGAEQAVRLQPHQAGQHAAPGAIGGHHRHGHHHQRLAGDLAAQRSGHHRLVRAHGLLEVSPIGQVGPVGRHTAVVQARQIGAVRGDGQQAVEQCVQGRFVQQVLFHRGLVQPGPVGAALCHGRQCTDQRIGLAAQQVGGALSLVAVGHQQLRA